MTTTATRETALGLRLLGERAGTEQGNLVLSPFGLQRVLAAVRLVALGLEAAFHPIEDEPTQTLLFAGNVRDPGTGDQETT